MNRRSFIKDISFASAIMLSGGIQELSAADIFENRKKVKLRFVVASDGHYGQPKTAFDAFFKTITDHINAFHKQQPLDFCVINRKNVFIFIHIPQAKWTPNGIDTPAFFDLIKKYPNVKAVFHGHEHDQDGVKMVDKIPFLFDSHFGGNWGTKYQGFRVVEVMKDNSMVTYMMNPTEKMNALNY